MRSLKLTLAYDGKSYSGWQFQPDRTTIQGVVEQAFLNVTGETARFTASGRTDAGVHAQAQVASCHTNVALGESVLLKAINAHLPLDIRVTAVEYRPSSFHAIRDALTKRYRYLIIDQPIHEVFLRDLVWFLPKRLNVGEMRTAAAHLVGRHDFAAFQASGSPRQSTVRTVHELVIQRVEHTLGATIQIEIEADGFLYNMVRNIVGSLVLIGQGKQRSEWILEVLRSRDRQNAGTTAPPQGLCLMAVTYPDDQA